MVLFQYQDDHMNSHSLLLQLVIILVSARTLSEMASYIRIPAVIGEMAAGIIIGPSILGWIQLSDPIQFMAQIGILLLLFEVGIETDLGQLTSAGKNALSVALVGVILPFILGFWISNYYFSFSLIVSSFIASTLTATSIGITLRVLRDLKRENTREAHVIIGAAVLDDIIGIILLAFLFDYATSGEVSWWNSGKLMLFILIFFITAPIAAKFVSTVIRKWDQKSELPGLLPTTIVSFMLLFSWISHSLGAPELLGSFAAGLAVSRQFFLPLGTFLHRTPEFSERIEKQIRPIIHLFTPIFFVSVGLSLNFHNSYFFSPYIWELTGLLLLVAILGKLLSGIFIKKISLIEKLIIGTSMVPRGEVGLIFANVGLTSGIFKDDLYAAMILVITITTIFTPISLSWLYRLKSHA